MRHEEVSMNMNLKLTGLEPVEVASRDELLALQLERLKWSLQHAYDNIAHYRTKFDKAGVHPGHLKSLADLAKFPFTTKADLRENYPYGMFAVPMRDIVRVHASSGTTGKPTVVGYTERDIAMWASVMARSLRAAGATADDIVLNSYGYGLFTGGLGAHYGVERLGAAVIPMSGGQTEKQVQMILDFQPTVLMSTRSTSKACPRSSDQAWPAKPSRPRTVRISGKTISIPRSLIPSAVRCCRTAPTANWCSPP